MKLFGNLQVAVLNEVFLRSSLKWTPLLDNGVYPMKCSVPYLITALNEEVVSQVGHKISS